MKINKGSNVVDPDHWIRIQGYDEKKKLKKCTAEHFFPFF
jgi:hypothetical protein